MELDRVTGSVLVEIFTDFEDLEMFFFFSFLFSDLRVLISDLNFWLVSERFSIF